MKIQADFWSRISGKCLGALCFCLVLLAGCSKPQGYTIYIGSKSTKAEYLACLDLKRDLEVATGFEVSVKNDTEEIDKFTYNIFVGSAQSNQIISELSKSGEIDLSESFPGPRGGIHQLVAWKGKNGVVLGGSDVQGTQYAVYDYCRDILGVDPLNEWTGTKIEKLGSFDPYVLKNHIIEPPRVSILSYFENDVDELANLKEPLLEYDMPSYRSLIDALVKMRYNAIQLFDQLGRKEYFVREPYLKLRPDYTVNLAKIDSLIDYTHDKGMMVQVELGLGFKMKSITDEEATCWTENKKSWIDTWVYYLEKTPLGKADIYSLRPRNQVWDWEYLSTCGERKADVFNEVYATLDSILKVHRPSATKVVICYDDAMEIFNDDFNPPKDWIISWSDNGYSRFKYLPEDTKGYAFGTYMHAGFWRNHTVHDPFPELIDSVMNMMFNDNGADTYCQVNGQTFRPFMFNLEAFSEVCRDPESFDGETFYRQWASRYFNQEAVGKTIEALKNLHAAHEGNPGYVNNLYEIKKLIAYLQDEPAVNNQNAFMVPFEAAVVPGLGKWHDQIFKAKEVAEDGLEVVTLNKDFYYDYVYFPILIYSQLLDFEKTLMDAAILKEGSGDIDSQKALLNSARIQLEEIYSTRIRGDKNPRWAGWYDPAKRRPNNGFPTVEMIDLALSKLNN